MERLSQREYWDSVHTVEGAEWTMAAGRQVANREKRSLKDRLKSTAKNLLGARTLEYMSSYDEYLFWDVILKKYLPQAEGARMLEIGSAPGLRLVKFKQELACNPFGVEYSRSGVEVNRKIFASHEIDEGNVIHADLFSDEFQQQYKESFDIVYSGGFIEHFTDVKMVIDKHLNLLAKGGYLIIDIPNLKGINYALTRLFHKEVIAIHNLEIMDRSGFAALFDDKRLSTIFCDYYGTFTFYLFNTAENSPKKLALSPLMKLQPFLNLLFRLLLKARGAEARLSSPFLLYIGRKKI